MNGTQIIGRHLPLPDGTPIGRCCMCAAVGAVGMSRKDALSDGFMDAAWLGPEPDVCVFCAACLGKGQTRPLWLRCTSFLATEAALLRLKREDIWPHLVSPPQDEPFVFGVSYALKKHIGFKAPVNPAWDGGPFRVQTEALTVEIDPAGREADLLGVIRRWYTVCKDTAQAPTWFTKADILRGGCENFKRIEEYGVDRYMVERMVLRPWVGTAQLELYVFALNKQPMEDK